jgi:hypothetical protein
MEHFAKLYKVDTDLDLELRLRNFRQDETETIIAFHTGWMRLMRLLDGNTILSTTWQG